MLDSQPAFGCCGCTVTVKDCHPASELTLPDAGQNSVTVLAQYKCVRLNHTHVPGCGMLGVLHGVASMLAHARVVAWRHADWVSLCCIPLVQAGQEDGVGMFTFRDGSTFEGFWHRGKKHGVGIFRPAAAPAASAMRSLKGAGTHLPGLLPSRNDTVNIAAYFPYHSRLS